MDERQIKYLGEINQIAQYTQYKSIKQTIFYATGGLNAWIPSDIWDDNKTVIHRSILWNELVFDLDFKKWKYNKAFAEQIGKALDDLGFSYYTFLTGGKGIHVSMFFTVDDNLFDWSWSSLREALYTRICLDYGIEKKLIDRTRIIWDDTSDGRIIRCCGGYRIINNMKSYKTCVDNIPKRRIYVSQPWEVNYPNKLITNNVTDYINSYLERQLKKVEKRQKKAKKVYGGVMPECIRQLIERAKKGENLSHEHRFLLMIWLLNIAYPADVYTEQERVDLVETYYMTMPDYDHEITTKMIRHAIAKGYHAPKLKTIKRAGLCVNCGRCDFE